MSDVTLDWDDLPWSEIPHTEEIFLVCVFDAYDKKAPCVEHLLASTPLQAEQQAEESFGYSCNVNWTRPVSLGQRTVYHGTVQGDLTCPRCNNRF